MQSERQTWAGSSRRAQTGKCPKSGEFFAIYLAMMGGFCPEKAGRFERSQKANCFIFSRVFGPFWVITLSGRCSLFFAISAHFSPRRGGFEAPSPALVVFHKGQQY